MSIFLVIVMITNFCLGFWLANKLGLGPGNPLKILLGSKKKEEGEGDAAQDSSPEPASQQAA